MFQLTFHSIIVLNQEYYRSLSSLSVRLSHQLPSPQLFESSFHSFIHLLDMLDLCQRQKERQALNVWWKVPKSMFKLNLMSEAHMEKKGRESQFKCVQIRYQGPEQGAEFALSECVIPNKGTNYRACTSGKELSNTMS